MTETLSPEASPSEARSPDAAPILELRRINKSFGAVHVLHDVDFAAYRGQVTAMVGDNGAGKSTLIKCVGGIHPIDSGEVYFEGRQVHVHSPSDANALGIEIVYQDLALCDNLDIVENMFLGRERTHGLTLDETSMERMAVRTLADLSVRTVSSVRQKVASLSGGQRQTVAIAKAVLWNNNVVILDEPTAALGVAQTRQVLDLVRRLADNGLAVVLISHNMNDVFEVADRIVALYLGRVAAEVRRADVTQQQVIELITTGQSGGARSAGPDNGGGLDRGTGVGPDRGTGNGPDRGAGTGVDLGGGPHHHDAGHGPDHDAGDGADNGADNGGDA